MSALRSKSLRRVLAIARKEVAHISRDPFTVALAIGLPLIMVFIFGSSIEFNLKEIPTAYLDLDKTQASRTLLRTFGSSDYFQAFAVSSPNELMEAVESENARALIVIPPRFEKDILSGRESQVQVLMDGADSTAVGAISGYLGQIQSRAAFSILEDRPRRPVRVISRYFFNPELNSKWFMVPGLVVVVMAILSILLTALTVAREWENGSMELLLATPVRPVEVIIGKLAPYAVLGLIGVALVYVLARTVFGVPFVGSHGVLLLGCLLFLITYLAQGLLISVTTRKQTLAMQLAMISGLLPAQLMSGFIFPIESMPTFFRYLTMILPARWFMEISRGSFLQGSTLWDLREPMIGLVLIGVFFITLSVRRFKKDVEP
jgi:ABC-2 type transport system permease protein